MNERKVGEEEVNRFLLDEIETVPHLEALLLLWNTRPQLWSEEKLCERLFVSADVIRSIMQDLVRRRLIEAQSKSANEYWYKCGVEATDRLIEALDDTYRKELVRVSTLIHSKAPSSVRAFARAFKFTKERE